MIGALYILIGFGIILVGVVGMSERKEQRGRHVRMSTSRLPGCHRWYPMHRAPRVHQILHTDVVCPLA